MDSNKKYIELILGFVKGIRVTFNERHPNVANDDTKVNFLSSLETQFSNIYAILNMINDEATRKAIYAITSNTEKSVKDYCQDFNPELLESTRGSIESLHSVVSAMISRGANTQEVPNKNIEEYNEKLKIYQAALKKHREIEKLYSDDKISYEVYKGSYDALENFYNSIMDEYKKLGVTGIETPVRATLLAKKSEDLVMKTLLEEKDKYERLLSIYEEEIYPDYAEAAQKYDLDEISQEEYDAIASETYRFYYDIDDMYKNLVEQFKAYQESLGSDEEYILVTQEEYEEYTKEVSTYNLDVKKYDELVKELEELKKRLDDSNIDINVSVEYQKKVRVVEETRIMLEKRQRELKRKRRKTYNPSVQTRLKKEREVIEKILISIHLSDNEKEYFQKRLDEIIKRIKEIEQVKQEIKIKTIRKTKRTVTTSKERVKSKIEDESKLERPTEFYYLGQKKQKPPVPTPTEKPKLDARAILIRLSGIDEKYKFGDNFALNYKNVKLWGWKKFKERTVLDKPMKLVKTAIGTVIKAPLKFFANISYAMKKGRLSELEKRVNALTNEELDCIIDEYGIDRLKEYAPHKAVMTALLPRLRKRINERIATNNAIIAKNNSKIIELYKQAQALKEKVASGRANDGERKTLEEISKELFKLVSGTLELRRKTNILANPARKESEVSIASQARAGGFFARNAVDNNVDAVDFVFGERLQEGLSSGDGFAAADAYISRAKLDKNNTAMTKSLINYFGERSTGSRYFSPFVELEEYEKNPYVTNVIQTVVLGVAVYNLINQIALQSQLDGYREVIEAQNRMIEAQSQAISTFQAKYSILQGKAAEVLDPATQQAFADDLRELATAQAGYIQGICEDFAQKSAAGALGKTSPIINSKIPEYGDLDHLAHTTTGGFIERLNGISSSSDPMREISELEALMKDMNDFMVDFTARSFGNVSKYMVARNAMGDGGFDFTAEQAFATSIAEANPTVAVELEYKLIDFAKSVGTVDITQLQTIESLAANADVPGAIAMLVGILGMSVAEDQLRETLAEYSTKSTKELSDEYAKQLDDVETEEEKSVRGKYQEELKAWEERGPIGRFFHKQPQKKRYNELYREEISEELERRLS